MSEKSDAVKSDKNFNSIIVGIVAIVAIIAILLGVFGSNRNFKGNSDLGNNQADLVGGAARIQINANSCNADKTCEMSNGLVDGFFNVKAGGSFGGGLTSPHATFGSVDIASNIIGTTASTPLILTSLNKNVVVDGDLALNNLNAHSINIGPVSIDDGGIISDKILYLDSHVGLIVVEESLVVNTNLTVHTLSGVGSAYVCVNHRGTIFRSPTPCV